MASDLRRADVKHLDLNHPALQEFTEGLPAQEKQRLIRQYEQMISDANPELIRRCWAEVGAGAVEILGRILLSSYFILRDNEESSRKILDLRDLALFLEQLRTGPERWLTYEVDRGLHQLDISVKRPARGRPVGRKSDVQNVKAFRDAQRVIWASSVWELKQEARRKHGSKWERPFRHWLREIGCSQTITDLTVKSKTERVLAIQLAASKLEKSYEAVDRSLRRFEALEKQQRLKPSRRTDPAPTFHEIIASVLSRLDAPKAGQK